ncbi:hypothetical protein FRC11_000237, partial [Ceratobasidium sp. 423]
MSNEPVDSASNDTLHHEEPTTYMHTSSSNTPESPKKLTGNLSNLTLEAQLGDNIVLEDPPNDNDEDPLNAQNPLSLTEPEEDEVPALHLSNTEEPADAQNPSSLTEPEEDEAPALHLSDTEEPKDNKDKPSDPMKWRPIPWDEAKEMSYKLNKFITSSFHGHGQMH